MIRQHDSVPLLLALFHLHAALSTSITPITAQFWDQQPETLLTAQRFTLDSNGTIEPPALLRGRMRATYDHHGAVLLTNTGLKTLEDMRKYVQLVLDEPMEAYAGGANPRDSLAEFFFEVGAPASASLHYHHEMAYVGQSTSQLAFSASTSLEGVERDGVKRGSTFLSDNVKVTDQLLQTELGRKLKARGLTYVRDLTDATAYEGADTHYEAASTVYNHWQKSFGTEDAEEAARRAREAGLAVEWMVDPHRENHTATYMRTRYNASAFEYDRNLDRNLVFSSIADDAHWFDSWPGLDSVTTEKRPLKLTFGDGSELTHEEWQQFVHVYDDHGFPIQWSQGDVLVFCNSRFAHGRPGYTVQPGERRDIAVALGRSFGRVGALAGKW